MIVWLQEEPYMMEKRPENGENLQGNDKYMGYCKDLADKIAEKLGITCKTWMTWRKYSMYLIQMNIDCTIINVDQFLGVYVRLQLLDIIGFLV